GVSERGETTVTISAARGDKAEQRKTERVLELLGWRMRTSRQRMKLEAVEKGDRAAHHETASALAIDEVAMQKALESGKLFAFRIPNESTDVILSEDAWRTQFYANKKYIGGFAEAIADNIDLAKIYVALGQMDPGTAAVLASGLGLKTLAEKYSVLLY